MQTSARSTKNNQHSSGVFSIRSLNLLIIGCLISLISACGGGGGSGDSEGSNSPAVEATYEVVVFANPFNAGTLTGGGTYREGEVAAITATPAAGYEFVSWTDSNGILVSEQPDFEIIVSQGNRLTANYQLIPTITEVGMPSDGIVIGFEAVRIVSGRIYAITKEATVGDGHAGLWLSNDDGMNWTQVLTGEVAFVSIASGDPYLVMAGGEDVYHLSTDGGVNWSTGVIRDPVFGNPMSFSDGAAFNASEGIFLATSSVMGPGLYRSIDQGGNWDRVLSEISAGSATDALLGHVRVSPEDPAVIYASAPFENNLWKSLDQGSSFFSVKTGLSNSDFLFSAGLALDPESADRLFVRDNITVNGGANWSQVSNLMPTNSFWLDGDLIRFNDYGFEGYAEISRDYGSTWRKVMILVQTGGARFSGVSGVYPTDEAVTPSRLLE
jgi:hypothetical protein